MTTTEAVQALAALTGNDQEVEHAKADDVLVDFLRANGHPDVADAYEQARRRVGFWYA